MIRAGWPWLALSALAASAGCRGSSSSNTGAPGSSAPGVEAAASAPAPPASTKSPEPVTRRIPCRPLALAGEIRVEPGDAPFRPSSPIDGATWLRLDQGASLSTRHGVSSRELSVRGPALVEPCVGGDEDWILTDGTVQTVAGPGARPGAEVHVFTPLGTVTYGDARLEIRAGPERVEVSALGGEAWVEAASGVNRSGPEHIAAPKGKVTLSGKVSAASLVVACERAAEAAEAAARAVLGPTPVDAGPDAGSLGERAAAHLHARRAARAACGSARAMVEADKDEAARRDFGARLASAEHRWRTISPSPAPVNSSGN